MPLTHKAKRRWAFLILLVAVPLYVVVAVNVVGLFERPPILLELLIYVVLGIAWAIPLKPIFLGVGQADPDER